jgi:hypothetical protein
MAVVLILKRKTKMKATVKTIGLRVIMVCGVMSILSVARSEVVTYDIIAPIPPGWTSTYKSFQSFTGTITADIPDFTDGQYTDNGSAITSFDLTLVTKGAGAATYTDGGDSNWVTAYSNNGGNPDIITYTPTTITLADNGFLDLTAYNDLNPLLYDPEVTWHNFVSKNNMLVYLDNNDTYNAQQMAAVASGEETAGMLIANGGQTVPEPGTLTLLGLAGLTGLAAFCIRRRRPIV